MLSHRDINPDGFAICTLYAIYLRCDMCLRHENSKDLYHIALSVAKYIAFCVTKYIAQARLYIAIVKSPEASQGADILPIEQIYKGGVPLFEERGTALIYTYSLILSFNRAYK